MGLTQEQRKTGRSMMPWVWFGIAVIIWVLFVGGLVVTAGSLDEVWGWVRDQSVVVQAVMWVALLPWMAALAIWESSWAMWLRSALVAGIAWANLFMFFPKAS